MKTISLLSMLAICSGVASAQLLTFGVTGGFPAQLPLQREASDMPFVIGPTVTVRILPRLSVESGLLYHRFGERTGNLAFPFPEDSFLLGFEQWRSSAIEIPFLAKYKILSDRYRIQPFVVAGPAIRRTAVDYTRYISVLGANPVSPGLVAPVNDESVKWNVDPVAGAGVTFRMGRLLLEPQVRYSNWRAGSNSIVRKNQVHFLFGFRF